MTAFVTNPLVLVVIGVLVVTLARAFTGLFTWLTVRSAIKGIPVAADRAAVLRELPPLFRGDWTLGPIARLGHPLVRGASSGQDTETPADLESANTIDDGKQDRYGDDQDDLR